MSKLSLIHSTQKAGPNTEIYGPRSEYGFLRTARRPIRMQDSSKPYNNSVYCMLVYCISYFSYEIYCLNSLTILLNSLVTLYRVVSEFNRVVNEFIRVVNQFNAIVKVLCS